MAVYIPSPAVSIVGRHNSGKTTRIEMLISELVSRGYDVGSIKHHSHQGFDIDIPGKDSYRHRAAGASETVISSPGQVARVRTIDGELECNDILKTMPGHDIVVVEGYRKSGLPTIEIMRSGNEADARVAEVFVEGAKLGWPLGTDFTQMGRGMKKAEEVDEDIPLVEESETTASTEHFAQHEPDYSDISNKLPGSLTEAVVSDIKEVHDAAKIYGIPVFDLDDVKSLADYVEGRYVRPRVTVVIQAGGESRRMGQSKATVPFGGRPLICRMIERLSPVADELIITTNEAEKLGFLKEQYPGLDIKLVPDEMNVRGALPGLYTAFKVASNPYVAIVACDMVFASAPLVAMQAQAMKETGVDVVVPRNKHGYEPFHAVYRRDTCLTPVHDALERGEKRAQSFFNAVNIYEYGQECVLEVEPMGGCFINVNTPEELKRIEDEFLNEPEPCC